MMDFTLDGTLPTKPKTFHPDSIPVGVIPEQCFTQEEFALLKKDINIHQLIEKYDSYPSFSALTDIRILKVYLDEKLCLVWKEGVVTFEIYVSHFFSPKSIAVTINGELAAAQLRDFPGGIYDAVNRVSQIDWSTMTQKSEAFLKRENYAKKAHFN